MEADFILVKVILNGKGKEVALEPGATISAALQEAGVKLDDKHALTLEIKGVAKEASTKTSLTENCTVMIANAVSGDFIPPQAERTVPAASSKKKLAGKKTVVKDYVMIKLEISNQTKELAFEPGTTIRDALDMEGISKKTTEGLNQVLVNGVLTDMDAPLIEDATIALPENETAGVPVVEGSEAQSARRPSRKVRYLRVGTITGDVVIRVQADNVILEIKKGTNVTNVIEALLKRFNQQVA